LSIIRGITSQWCKRWLSPKLIWDVEVSTDPEGNLTADWKYLLLNPQGYLLLLLRSPGRFPVPEPTEDPTKDVGTHSLEDSASFLLQWEE